MIDLTPFFQAVIALLATAITCIIIPLIRKHTSEQQYRLLQIAARMSVEFAEQMYKGSGRGDEKLDCALTWLEGQGFTFDEPTLRAAVEQAVHQMTHNETAIPQAVQPAAKPPDAYDPEPREEEKPELADPDWDERK